MKNLLILYNIIFFFAGNILLSNIHYLDHHHHDLKENHKCSECINFENSNDCNLDLIEIKFLNAFEFFALEYSDIVDFSFRKKYQSRAPPIS